ncbi:MAG TPA: prepilin-type N-terminal cleavage/methylation domain-containing protein [Rariglobus sp.]|jgi:prepilin-type N-terminal cleavage/methylation domain-containing protein|nr:prepilin-type N-terminal cleavage/methylation domain-containing protein [Rariglobus sp.]
MLLLSTNAPAFSRDASSPRSNCGFTLIELLTVIAIIAILAGITLGVASGAKTRASIGQARTELSTIAQALESYKRQYGDYPQTNDSHALLNALAGLRGPKYDALLNSMTGKNFLELEKFTLSNSANANDTQLDPATGTVTLVDPWGTPYYYAYKSTATLASTWTHSYVLYSKGPPNSLNNQNPANGPDVTTDGTGQINNTTDSTGQLLAKFASYIFANQ